jgi:NADH:ubiquinone oxidoreductase subunit
VKQKIERSTKGREKLEVQKWRENERNNEHDKIVQYFPQSSMAKFLGKI